MTTEAQTTTPGAWRRWSYRHRLLVSALSHLAMFVLAWLLAFGLAYNFTGSPTLGWPVVWLKSLFVHVEPSGPGSSHVDSRPKLIKSRPLYLPLRP